MVEQILEEIEDIETLEEIARPTTKKEIEANYSQMLTHVYNQFTNKRDHLDATLAEVDIYIQNESREQYLSNLEHRLLQELPDESSEIKAALAWENGGKRRYTQELLPLYKNHVLSQLDISEKEKPLFEKFYDNLVHMEARKNIVLNKDKELKHTMGLGGFIAGGVIGLKFGLILGIPIALGALYAGSKFGSYLGKRKIKKQFKKEYKVTKKFYLTQLMEGHS